MSESKHSPGPWTFCGDSIQDKDGFSLFRLGMDRGEYDANVRLIEVAPLLLEACEAALSQLDYLRNLWNDEEITLMVADKVRAAVHAARNGDG